MRARQLLPEAEVELEEAAAGGTEACGAEPSGPPPTHVHKGLLGVAVLFVALGLVELFASGVFELEAPVPPPIPPPSPAAPMGPRGVPLIIDTDMSFDVDDVGAICIAHALHDSGEANLLAVVHSTGYPEGIGAASVLNEWYGHQEVKLGAYKGEYGANSTGQWITGFYVPELVRRFPSRIKTSAEVPDAVEVYREVLASRDDHSVVIAVIGFATNMAALLRSPPDAGSSLTGAELVAKKVRQVVWQGGWYPPRHLNGHTTFNWDCGVCCGYTTVHGCAGDASYAVMHMPPNVEQVYTDLGDQVYHGGQGLRSCASTSNPCLQAYLLHPWGMNIRGRQSWDPLAVVAAVLGPHTIYSTKTGYGGVNSVDFNGANFWSAGNSTLQSFLSWQGTSPWYAERTQASNLLDRLLCARPTHAQPES
ncbi:hypothetical protein AB1Y20_013133 [Prymnesium parvum]|uniref:Inosine/uridine-preferring nucleoside hydrolase domain-containing protein n=1 Tax=Prymnesium parvum TaxID=97485 RepID=A0AB34IMR7_PRYPA